MRDPLIVTNHGTDVTSLQVMGGPKTDDERCFAYFWMVSNLLTKKGQSTFVRA